MTKKTTINKIVSSKAFWIIISLLASFLLWTYIMSTEETTIEMTFSNVKVVCKTALDKVISVNVLLHANKAGLFLRRCPQRDDWERRIISAVTNNRPVNAAFCNDLLVVSLFVQNLDFLVLLFFLNHF